jgi:hypothetical protein
MLSKIAIHQLSHADFHAHQIPLGTPSAADDNRMQSRHPHHQPRGKPE